MDFHDVLNVSEVLMHILSLRVPVDFKINGLS